MWNRFRNRSELKNSIIVQFKMEITSHDSCISMDRIKGGGARRTAGAVIKLLMRALKHNRARNSA